AKVLILDEPTASLDTQEVELLFGLMRQLRDRGVSLIFVTHFLDQVYQVSDRITVLRNGSFVGCRETRELPQIELVKMMLGRELDTHALQRAGRTLLSDKPVAAFKNYGKKGTIAPFDLEVRPGEIVGLAGLLGSGRTETAEVIFGIKPADSGTALIKGKPQTLRSPHQASVLGIGFCPEDRKTDGIIAAASVRENIILALQAQRGWLRPISRKEQQEIAERFIRQLGIRTPSTEQPIEFLSGGNQQKVVGYSQDYSNAIVEAVKKKLNKPDLQVKLIPITSQNRIPLLQNGTFDFECGSTTNNAERQKQAAFSNTIFVVGTRLLTKKGGDIKDFADLKGKAVVVTSGTTSEVLLNKLNEEQKMNMRI
ncbi:transporter substrate-binding domain-containing protein, partial [Escherichia coli]|nr:transporter substrate-binding domain-containing protein [Escherichia coli]